MCHVCVKRFLDSNFNLVVSDKMSFFHKIAPNSTYSQNRNLRVLLERDDQLLLPINFMTGKCKESTFFFFFFFHFWQL